MKRLILFLIATAILIGGVTLAVHPVFQIQTVRSQGANFVNADELDASLQAYREKNLFLSWIWATLTQHPKETRPQVQSSAFSIKLPHTLYLNIYEKPPMLSFLTPQKNWLVAQDGTILNTGTHPTETHNLNELVIIRGYPNTIFEEDHIAPEILEGIDQVIKAIRRHVPERNIQIEFEKGNTIILIIDDVVPVYIGKMEGLDIKLKNLNRFLRFLQSQNQPITSIEYIDLRVISEVVVKHTPQK